MVEIATLADTRALEAEMPVTARWSARTLYEQLSETASRFPDRPAISFQLRSDPKERAVTLTWSELRAEVTRMANLLRRLGIGEGDTVAYVLPNCVEAAVALMAGATAGRVVPVNPLLAPEVIGGILRDTGAKAVVTLGPFPKTDLAEKVAGALAHAPGVTHVIEVDLGRYLGLPARWIVPFVKPKRQTRPAATIVPYSAARREDGGALAFAEGDPERFCAMFHTGGTTGLPKVAQHRARGILYNGWIGRTYMFTEQDVLLCPLPLFHVFAAYPVWMSCLASGAHFVMVTPQGYRGEGVFRNFWKLVERWRVTFMITVPTAVSMLMQHKVDADVSSLRLAVSGSAPMPVELFNRFEAATGVKVLEGYGLTEATCLVSINPPFGERKIGSVGLPFAYTDVKILQCDAQGTVLRTCAVEEVGEICVRNPGTTPGETYTEGGRNRGLYAGEYLRTGDLGRIDADGYLWITGRAKDLIIRGGHNIDPGVIEDALMKHPEVAAVGAIGEPNAHSGEVPAVYVELVEGATVAGKELLAFARECVGEKAAVPRHVEVLPELPKTAVGKIFKPDLRKRAIARVYGEALADAGLDARVIEVVEDPRRGLVARIDPGTSDAGVAAALGSYTVPWEVARRG
jgi:acyl-CoA synthetase (AMP-forming)/AMP-acid ligase II